MVGLSMRWRSGVVRHNSRVILRTAGLIGRRARASGRSEHLTGGPARLLRRDPMCAGRNIDAAYPDHTDESPGRHHGDTANPSIRVKNSSCASSIGLPMPGGSHGRVKISGTQYGQQLVRTGQSSAVTMALYFT